MKGGYRAGAGRKKGFAAKNAEEARRVLTLVDDFRTLNWVELYPQPTLALKELQILLG